MKVSLSHWYPGSGVVLDLSIPDLCPLSYFGKKLYRQIVGMGTNCAPLFGDLVLFYERDFMLSSLSDNYQAGVVEAFYSTSIYLDDLLDIDNPHFEQKVNQICPTELQSNRANSFDTEATLWTWTSP